jgi:hypothetical protein
MSITFYHSTLDEMLLSSNRGSNYPLREEKKKLYIKKKKKKKVQDNNIGSSVIILHKKIFNHRQLSITAGVQVCHRQQ